MARTITGTLAALATTAALTAAMLPLRAQIGTAIPALVLVVPVLVGVVAGGFLAGILSVLAGFLVFEIIFSPPYLTMTVDDPQNWATLGIYAAVMLPVAKLVASLDAAKAAARRQEREIRHLFEISDLLVEDKPLEVLLRTVVTTVAEAFAAEQVALLLPDSLRKGDPLAIRPLQVVASTGPPLSAAQLRRVVPAASEPASLEPRPFERDGLLVVALAAAGRPVGLLVLSAEAADGRDREPLLLFANHIALALERVQLRDRALQVRLSEEVGRLAKTLVGAVSHDLRAPLARIKASSSTLADAELAIDADKIRGLAAVIDVQADRLADLVQNLLDMSRIQAGVLQPRYAVAPLGDLVATVVKDLGWRSHPIEVEMPDDLPPIDADLVLVSRVLTNLLENALRFSPKDAPVTVAARLDQDHNRPDHNRVEVSVTDRGPGVAPERRQEIFELFARRDGDSGAGLGLTIAKTFVEAHGQRIGVDDAPGGGAVFHFTLPIAAGIAGGIADGTAAEEPRLAADTHR